MTTWGSFGGTSEHLPSKFDKSNTHKHNSQWIRNSVVRECVPVCLPAWVFLLACMSARVPMTVRVCHTPNESRSEWATLAKSACLYEAPADFYLAVCLCYSLRRKAFLRCVCLCEIRFPFDCMRSRVCASCSSGRIVFVCAFLRPARETGQTSEERTIRSALGAGKANKNSQKRKANFARRSEQTNRERARDREFQIRTMRK